MTSCPRCRRTFEDGIRFCPVDGALVSQAVSDPNIGRVLMGQFELREVAGRGAMGTVYRAYQRTMDRVVAVKILRGEIVKEPGVLRRFLREARAAARLQHPNIVTVHMVGETEDGVPYLVMEHIDGVSLEAICEAQGAQPLPRVCWFGRQIASALSEAHNVGIIHRDLKPANILVTDRSRTPDLVKVLDFGIAKLLTSDGPDQSIVTADGTIFGTPHYIAPEQASGGDVDHRADIYSLGVLLFRLTTGVLPFEGTQSMQVVLKHLRDEPPSPRSIDPTIPQAMEDLILSCLAKNRARRPEDADAVATALDKIDAELGQHTIKGMPLKRLESHKTPVPAEVLPPVHAPQKTPQWVVSASGERSRVSTPAGGQRVSASGERQRVSTPAGGQRVSASGERQRMSSSGERSRVSTPAGGHRVGNHTPRSVTAQVAAHRSRGNRAVWIGVVLAAGIGSSIGVLAALGHNAVDDREAPPRASLQRTAPANSIAASPAPVAAAPNASATNPAPNATAAAAGVAPAIVATPAVAAAPVKSSLVDARGRAVPSAAKPVAALRRHGAHDAADDDLPVTVVPADAPKVVARPLPVTHAASAPTASSSPAPSAPAPAQPTPPVTTPAQPAPSAPPAAAHVEPPPVAAPPKTQPRDDEPPPAPPPQSDDPTTLPSPPPAS